MKNKLIFLLSKNINSSEKQLKFLFLFQWFLISFWWRLWKFNDEIIKIPLVFESFFSNQLTHYIIYIIYSVSVFLIFLNRKFFIGISIGLVFFIVSDFFTYHHDIYSMLILSIASQFYLNKRFFYIGFLSSMYILSSFSKMNNLFLDGKLLGMLLETEFGYIFNNIFLIFLSYLTVFFELLAGLFIFFKRKNYFIVISLILFHYFMGIFLGRGVVFNLLFVLLITEIYKDQISNKLYWLYYFISVLVIVYNIIVIKFT